MDKNISAKKFDEQLMAQWLQLNGDLGGFRHACFLITAHHIGLLRCLSNGERKTAPALATELKVDLLGLELLSRNLSVLGYLEIENGVINISPKWQNAFSNTSNSSLLKEISLSALAIKEWLKLSDIIKHGTMPSKLYRECFFNGESHDYKGLQAYNRIRCDDVLELIHSFLLNTESILDIAGADGVFADKILKKYSRATVTLLDLKNALQACNRRYTQHINADRLHLHEGDARTFNLKNKFDLILMTEVTELFNYADKKNVIANAVAHLEAYGKLVVTKFSLPENELSTSHLSSFSMKMYIKSPGAYLETDEELIALLEAQGLQCERQYLEEKFVVTCTKL